MTPTLTALHDSPRQLWRNGGGVTRELLAWPDAQDWRLRISVADIEADGPFSTFPGAQRWFAVLLGGGIALTVDGVEHVCHPSDDALQFSGAATAAARLLRGTSRDLNLMLRELPGSMHRVVDGHFWKPRARQCGLYAIATGCCVTGDTSINVPAESLMWFASARDVLTFHAEAAMHTPVPGWWLAAGIAEPDA